MRTTNVNTSVLLLAWCLGGCVAVAPAMDADTDRDAALSDALSMVDAAHDDTLRIFNPVDREFRYGAASSHLLGSTAPYEGRGTILLGLWEDRRGCDVIRTGVDPDEVVDIHIHVRGAAIDATHDLPPTVGDYPIAAIVAAGHDLAPEESDIYFRYVRDGVFMGNLYGESGTLTIEAVSTTEITIFVDAMLTGGVAIRGRATIGLCLP